MNEPRKAGRPRKHLEQEHHFQTSADAFAAGAPPADAEVDQTGASVVETQPSAPVAPKEDVVENPTIAQSVDTEIGSQDTFPLASSQQEELAHAVIAVDSYTNSQQIIESPIEETIHSLVEKEIESKNLNGWHPIDTDIVIEHPPRNGMPVRLSRIPDGDGTLAYWKRSRTFANPTKRWQESGNWYNFNTSVKIDFEPKYWKERF